ncbi:PEP-CTERM sorting domain-containing protein [Coraliomargarita sp. SDUM461003]|uniref:PEP-CTERM sorting domain-containing protein n=1 Tax=Thalassobacterium maritimum TaxID=3041265 RepID=A0ABU1AQJ6_9BACT|nr:PEP-CTERM sorting domain-containing protein [Coraliomargarita sp. SDUM461003]MDQ8206313.1 PEP-CTERM sorting domain-containing protein [Coraliomargarita sp. SDUM461003]
MKKQLKTLPLLVTAGLATTASASAAVIAQYDFNSATDTFADSANASGLTAGEITPGTLMATDDGRSTTSTSEGAGSYFARWNAINAANGSTSAAWGNAQSNGIYLEFTLTPDAGTSLNLTDLHLDVAYNGTDNFRLAVTSSLTGYNYADRLTISTELTADASSLPNILQSNLGGIETAPDETDADWGQGEDTIIDLSSATFDNIASDVTFRIYAFSLTSSTSILRLDNVHVNGTVIPEPGSYALLVGILGLTSVMIRRRR